MDNVYTLYIIPWTSCIFSFTDKIAKRSWFFGIRCQYHYITIIISNKIETINFLLHSSNSKKDQWKDEHDHKYLQQNKFKWYCANIVCASVVNYVSYCLCDFSIHPQSWREKESIFYENIKIRKTAIGIPWSRDPAHK